MKKHLVSQLLLKARQYLAVLLFLLSLSSSAPRLLCLISPRIIVTAAVNHLTAPVAKLASTGLRDRVRSQFGFQPRSGRGAQASLTDSYSGDISAPVFLEVLKFWLYFANCICKVFFVLPCSCRKQLLHAPVVEELELLFKNTKRDKHRLARATTAATVL